MVFKNSGFVSVLHNDNAVIVAIFSDCCKQCWACYLKNLISCSYYSYYSYKNEVSNCLIV